MSLVVLGTVAIDNLTTPSGVRKNLLGGSAVHFSMSARFFTKVHLASVVGRDFPKKYRIFLKDKGLDFSSVLEKEGKTFSWTGEFKSDDMGNAITHTTELGVLPNYLPTLTSQQKDIENVFLANFDPDIQRKFLDLMNKPKFVGLDSMNLWIDSKQKSLRSLIKKVDLLILNDGEARMLSGENNLIRAAKRLRTMGARFIIIKKGADGVFVYSDQFMFSFSAYPIEKVIDPTGAGDTFAGGLMGTLAKVKRIDEKALRLAVVNATTFASFNVQGFAMAKTSVLMKASIDERRKEYLSFITP